MRVNGLSSRKQLVCDMKLEGACLASLGEDAASLRTAS